MKAKPARGGDGKERKSGTRRSTTHFVDDDWKAQATATLGGGNLRLAVVLPEGEDRNEWIAANVVDFNVQVNMLYGTLTEFCTPTSCPRMTAGHRYEFRWADERDPSKPRACSAPQYCDLLLTWIQEQLDDEQRFPSRLGVPFPPDFEELARSIFRRLFRVYAHIYHHHFAHVIALDEEAHLNTSFKHLVYFVREFGLVEQRDLAPLGELVDYLLQRDVLRDSSPPAPQALPAASAPSPSASNGQSSRSD